MCRCGFGRDTWSICRTTLSTELYVITTTRVVFSETVKSASNCNHIA